MSGNVEWLKTSWAMHRGFSILIPTKCPKNNFIGFVSCLVLYREFWDCSIVCANGIRVGKKWNSYSEFMIITYLLIQPRTNILKSKNTGDHQNVKHCFLPYWICQRARFTESGGSIDVNSLIVYNFDGIHCSVEAIAICSAEVILQFVLWCMMYEWLVEFKWKCI